MISKEDREFADMAVRHRAGEGKRPKRRMMKDSLGLLASNRVKVQPIYVAPDGSDSVWKQIYGANEEISQRDTEDFLIKASTNFHRFDRDYLCTVDGDAEAHLVHADVCAQLKNHLRISPLLKGHL